ncbi:hypothetical protein [Pseudoalteromonas denitrificans]|uniref:Uncharacterized protein n=1 Tax=Pseudoalteromonas denitrificans DSM 6059 TaxID=1123010 RepID=A0A1I1I6N8_9GAMM|nr:hypothetical protein [Pseudoalteromonas denitrificans]SFC31796.1 hypothetical protein SAMN02745724_01401 [Pseudoalteromonas denitrificans DSM 6059]
MSDIHIFSVSDARKFGLIESILLRYFKQQLKHNKLNGTHIKNDFVWTKISDSALTEIFNYLEPTDISNTLKSMQKRGLIDIVRNNEFVACYTTSEFNIYGAKPQVPQFQDEEITKNIAVTDVKETSSSISISVDKLIFDQQVLLIAKSVGFSANIEDIELQWEMFIAHNSDKNVLELKPIIRWHAAWRKWIASAKIYSRNSQYGKASIKNSNGLTNTTSEDLVSEGEIIKRKVSDLSNDR